MPTCPKCKNEENVQFIAKYMTDEEIEIQMVCLNCANIFRELIIFDGREIIA